MYARGHQYPVQQLLSDVGVDEKVRPTLRQHFPDEQQVMANDGQVDQDLRGNDDENEMAAEATKARVQQIMQQIEQVQAGLAQVKLMNNPDRLREYTQRHQPMLDQLGKELGQQIEQHEARNRMGGRANSRGQFARFTRNQLPGGKPGGLGSFWKQSNNLR